MIVVYGCETLKLLLFHVYDAAAT